MDEQASAAAPQAHDLVRTLLDGTDARILFEPVTIAGLRLRNRFVMSPMTRQFSPGGVPGDEVAAYYARRAASLGLIISEGTYVNEPSSGSHGAVPRFFGDDALAGWRNVVAAVHGSGAAMFPQLWHIGSQRMAGMPPDPGAPVVSPSGYNTQGERVGEPASHQALEAIAAAFGQAAVDAKHAGFDGVEVHGAHGYLLDQFHWPFTNRRTDAYGGDITGRVRLSAEVVRAIRAAAGPDFPVSFRFSQWKGVNYGARIADTPEELAAFLEPLAEAGVSIFHASARRYWLPAFPGEGRTLAGWTRRITGLPVIGVGSVGVAPAFLSKTGEEEQRSLSLAPLVDLITGGEIDLAATGRAVLIDPEWVGKAQAGRLGDIRLYRTADDATLF